MPRKSRIDAAGALHHIIARGIDRSKIFQDTGAVLRLFGEKVSAAKRQYRAYVESWGSVWPNYRGE